MSPGWHRSVVVVFLTCLTVLAASWPMRVIADDESGVKLKKTVTAATITPNLSLSLSLGAGQANAIPGDVITYTSTLLNSGATVGISGQIVQAYHAVVEDSHVAPSATVVAYWDAVSTSAPKKEGGCSSSEDGSEDSSDVKWLPLAGQAASVPGWKVADPAPISTGLILTATGVPNPKVVFPATGDPFLGTVITNTTASWNYQAALQLTPAQVSFLLDRTKVCGIRNTIHIELKAGPASTADGSDESSHAIKASTSTKFSSKLLLKTTTGDLKAATITITPPTGSAVVFNSTTTKALADLAPGASVTVTLPFTVPVIAPRGALEPETDYLTRLRAADGAALKATATAAGTGSAGPVSATATPVTTTEHVPVLGIAKSGPTTVDAGTTESNPLAISNSGGAPASQLAILDSVPGGATGAVSGLPATLEAAAIGSAVAAFPVPSGQPAGPLTDTAALTWADAHGNPYGPVSSSFTTVVRNNLFGAALTLAPSSAGPNVPGTTQTLTATLLDHSQQPIANQAVSFSITGANAQTGSATTDANGKAVFTYTGANAGNDVAQATVSASGVTLSSNTASISWGQLLQTVATTPVQGNFFPNPNNSCTFDVGPNTGTPVFGQTFPDILFNPPAGAVPHSISSVTTTSRPFTDLTVDVNGNYNGEIVAQGNGLQAGSGTLANFYAEFTGSFIVNRPGDLTFTILHNDGYILGIGNGATRVNGDLLNDPTATPFNGYGVIAASNGPATNQPGTATAHFPAAGTYPFELDYSQCGGAAPDPLYLVLETAQFVAQTDPLSIYVGYADGLRAGGAAFPFPWQGSAGVTFVGGCTFDAGAIRFDNSGDSPITLDSVTVDLGAPPGSPHFDIWGPNPLVVPAHQILILTQTGCYNFDSSDFSGAGCGGNNNVLPLVNVTVGGVAKTYTDSQQILNTRGYDLACQGNESLPWQRIAGSASAINVPLPPAASLDISPFRVPGALLGQNQPLTVSAMDGAGNPVVNLPVTLQVFGPNAQTLNATTLTNGLATFGYVGVAAGTDSIQASASIGGLRVISNLGSVTWTPPAGGGPNPLPDPNAPPPPAIGPLSIADGSVVTKPVTVSATVTPPGVESITSWRVFYQEGTGPLVTIGSGTGAPPATLATFDPTDLPNDSYGITVEATASGGGIQDLTATVAVLGNLKLGRYTTTFQDLSVPVAGFPMEVRRTYDSIDTSAGDFGVGWRVSVSNFRTEPNRVLGAAGWTQYNKSCTLGLCFTAFKNAAARFVTVTFPDQHSEVFDFTPNGGTNLFWECAPAFTARASVGTTSTLQAFDDTSCSYTGDGNLYGSNGLYAPKQFKLTTRDGRILLLDVAKGLLSQQDPSGNLLTVDSSGIHSSAGPSITFSRDGQGRITDVSGPVAAQHLHYDYAGSFNELQTVTDPNGHATTYAYTAAGRLQSVTGPDGQPVQTITYDASGRAISVANGSQPATSVTINVAAQQNTVLDPNARLTTIYTYDDLGDVIEKDQVFSGQTLRTTYQYDAVGHRTQLVDPLGHSWSWSFDASGNILSYTDGAGRTWRFQNYNSFGEFGMALAPDGSPLLTQTYDAAGLALTKQRAGESPTTYTYLAHGLLGTMTDPGGRTVNFSYDSAGHMTSRSDSLGQATTYTVDAAGRVSAIQDPLGHSTSMVYDGLGNITSVTDGNGNTSQRVYDGYGRLQETKDPLGHSVLDTYNSVGLLQQRVDRNGATTTYAYDVDGNLVRETRPNGDILNFAYDPLSRLTSAANASAHDDFSYNANSQPASQTSCGPTATATTPCSAGAAATQPLVTLSYAYTAENLLAGISGPDGQTSYAFDGFGRLATITDPAHQTFSYTYGAASQPLGLTRPNGVNDTYSFNGSVELTGLSSAQSGSVVSQNQYSFDPATGRIISMTDSSGANGYTYLADGELSSANHPAASGLAAEAYTYDAAGNRLSWAGSPASAVSYDAADRLLSDGSSAYSYDAEGNLVTKAALVNPTSRTTYDWNVDHQLLAVHYPDGTSSRYSYDALGRRVQSVAPSGATARYVWDAVGNVHAQYDGSNNLLASYVQNLGQDRPLEVTEGGHSYFYLADGAGNVRALTDQAGAVVDSYRYDSFGNQLATGSVPNPFTFAGRELDAASGLYFNRARWYDPRSGRFLSEDPQPSVNPYVYVGNNPVSLNDPSGKTFGEIGLIYTVTDEGVLVLVEEEVTLTATIGYAAPILFAGEVEIDTFGMLVLALQSASLWIRLLAVVLVILVAAATICDIIAQASEPPPGPVYKGPVVKPTPTGINCGPEQIPDIDSGTRPVVGPKP